MVSSYDKGLVKVLTNYITSLTTMILFEIQRACQTIPLGNRLSTKRRLADSVVTFAKEEVAVRLSNSFSFFSPVFSTSRWIAVLSLEKTGDSSFCFRK